MKKMSDAAIVAKEIRAILKANGVKGSVRSDNYSGGNAVRAYLSEEISPELYAKIFWAADKFRAGSFNGMEDIYEYRPNSNGPTANYIFFNSSEGYLMGYPKAEAAA
jgi:hypothetical protein